MCNKLEGMPYPSMNHSYIPSFHTTKDPHSVILELTLQGHYKQEAAMEQRRHMHFCSHIAPQEQFT